MAWNVEDSTPPTPDNQPPHLTIPSLIALESLCLWLLKNPLLHNGHFIFPIKTEPSFHFLFEYANSGSLAKFPIISQCQVQTAFCLLIISPELLFPTVKMVPEEATFPGMRIQVEDKAIVSLEQMKSPSIPVPPRKTKKRHKGKVLLSWTRRISNGHLEETMRG